MLQRPNRGELVPNENQAGWELATDDDLGILETKSQLLRKDFFFSEITAEISEKFRAESHFFIHRAETTPGNHPPDPTSNRPG